MKYIFSGLLISLIFTFCKGQKLSSKAPVGSFEAKKIIKDTAIALTFNAESQMSIYADSLNNLPKESPLPSFLIDECFDLKTVYWPDMHHPISLRQIVVRKVTNKLVIERVLKDNNPLLRKVCNMKDLPRVPDSQKSFYELFKLRYAELK